MNFHNMCERNINGGKMNWQLRYRGEVGLGKALFKYKWATAGLFLPNVLLHQVLLHQSIATSKHLSIHSQCILSQCIATSSIARSSIPSKCTATSSIATPKYCHTKLLLHQVFQHQALLYQSIPTYIPQSIATQLQSARIFRITFQQRMLNSGNLLNKTSCKY